MDTTKVALPNLIVIGAMKCGTSALHAYLSRHPEIQMSRPKELNFFFRRRPVELRGAHRRSEEWMAGNWHRGVEWYSRHFRATARVRGESSPGYTSPAHPDVPARMARVVPRARLVLMVRHPVERALSQYRHHRREGTETRSCKQALLDSQSQYIARSRYYDGLRPYLDHFPAQQIAIVCTEELVAQPRVVLDGLARFLDVDADGFGSVRAEMSSRSQLGRTSWVGDDVQTELWNLVQDDVDRLRTFASRDFPWRAHRREFDALEVAGGERP